MSEKIIYVGNAAFTSKGLLSAVYHENKLYLTYDDGRGLALQVESEEDGNKSIKSIYEQWAEKPKLEVSLDTSKVKEIVEKAVIQLNSDLEKGIAKPYAINLLELDDRVQLFGSEYQARENGGYFYLEEMTSMDNERCFLDAGIKYDDKEDFVKDVVGYYPASGLFPEVKSLYDLSLVYDRLKKIETDKTSKQ